MNTSIIKAPKGQVLKGYFISANILVEHCLVDDGGWVFVKGHGGWNRSYQKSGWARVVVLPNAVPKGNDYNQLTWNWEDWYERNWLCDSWAWIYGGYGIRKMKVA